MFFDNNLFEKSLWIAKIKMKVSSQFANIKSSEYYAKIRIYIENCERHNINEHIALVILVEGNCYNLE